MFFVRSKTMGLLSRILVFLLVITMFSVTGPLSPEVSDATDEITVGSADSLLDAINDMEDNSKLTVKLKSDIELNDPASPPEEDVTAGLVIDGKKTVTIIFKGHTISSSVLDKVIDVERGSKFVFGDEGDVINTSQK